MALADVVHEAQEPSAKIYSEENFSHFNARFKGLSDVCKNELIKQGFPLENIKLEPYLHMRYDGTDCALMCGSNELNYSSFLMKFLERYQTEFGFVIKDRDIIIDDIRIRGVGKTNIEEEIAKEIVGNEPKCEGVSSVYFEGGYRDTNIYLLEKLANGHVINGPAIIMDQLSTILIEPDCTGQITKYGDIKIKIGTGQIKRIGPELDSIQLSIFSHRFMSIAEQMGRSVLISFRIINI